MTRKTITISAAETRKSSEVKSQKTFGNKRSPQKSRLPENKKELTVTKTKTYTQPKKRWNDNKKKSPSTPGTTQVRSYKASDENKKRGAHHPKTKKTTVSMRLKNVNSQNAEFFLTPRHMRALLKGAKKKTITTATRQAREFRLPLLRNQLFTAWVARGAKQSVPSTVFHPAEVSGLKQRALKRIARRHRAKLRRPMFRDYRARLLYRTAPYTQKGVLKVRFRAIPEFMKRDLRPYFVSYSPTLRSLWQFFAHYRRTVCRKETLRWQRRKFKQLYWWILWNTAKPYAKRFANEDTIYKIHAAIASGISVEEARIASIQRKFRKWLLATTIAHDKPLAWLFKQQLNAVRLLQRLRRLYRFAQAKKLPLTKSAFSETLKQLLPKQRRVRLFHSKHLVRLRRLRKRKGRALAAIRTWQNQPFATWKAQKIPQGASKVVRRYLKYRNMMILGRRRQLFRGIRIFRTRKRVVKNRAFLLMQWRVQKERRRRRKARDFVMSLLWQFVSPEFKLKKRATITGIRKKHVKEQEAEVWLQEKRWQSFETWGRDDARLAAYADVRADIQEEWKELRLKKIKRIYAPRAKLVRKPWQKLYPQDIWGKFNKVTLVPQKRHFLKINPHLLHTGTVAKRQFSSSSRHFTVYKRCIPQRRLRSLRLHERRLTEKRVALLAASERWRRRRFVRAPRGRLGVPRPAKRVLPALRAMLHRRRRSLISRRQELRRQVGAVTGCTSADIYLPATKTTPTAYDLASRTSLMRHAKMKKFARARAKYWDTQRLPSKLFRTFALFRTQLRLVRRATRLRRDQALHDLLERHALPQIPFHVDSFPFLSTKHSRRRILASLRIAETASRPMRRLLGSTGALPRKIKHFYCTRQQLLGSVFASVTESLHKRSQLPVSNTADNRVRSIARCRPRSVGRNKKNRVALGRRLRVRCILRSLHRRRKLATTRRRAQFLLLRKGRGGRRAFRRKVNGPLWARKKARKKIRRDRRHQRRKQLKQTRKFNSPTTRRPLRLKRLRACVRTIASKLKRWRGTLYPRTASKRTRSRRWSKRQVRRARIVASVKGKAARVSRRSALHKVYSNASRQTKASRRTLRALFTKLPYFVPKYTRRSRLHAKVSRPPVTKRAQLRQKAINNARLLKVVALVNKRGAHAAQWSLLGAPFFMPASVQMEERFKRKLFKNRDRDRLGDLPTEIRAGSPSTFGYRRLRRVLVPRFNSTRGWRPSPLATGLPHLPAVQRMAARTQRDFKIYRSRSRRRVRLLVEKTPFTGVLRLTRAPSPVLRAPAQVNHTEKRLKKMKKVRSSPNNENQRRAGIVVFNAAHPRFPALARRRRTFDAFLRVQYSRQVPTKFHKFTVKHVGRFYRGASSRTQALRLRSKRTLRLSSRAGQIMASTRYIPRRIREVRNAAANPAKVTGRSLVATPTLEHKQQFSASSWRTVARVQASAHRALLRVKESQAHTGNTLALLQAALRKRFTTRRIRDLRKAGRRRKLVSTAKPSFWIRNKRDRRDRKAARFVSYRLAGQSRRSRFYSHQWWWDQFYLRVAKRRKRVVRRETSAGELLRPVTKVIRSSVARASRYARLNIRARGWHSHYFIKRRYRMFREIRRFKIRKKRRYFPMRWKRKNFRKRRKWKNKLFSSHFPLTIRSVKHTVRRHDAAANKFSFRLTTQPQTKMLLSPLHFRRKTLHISTTAAEKERYRLHTQMARLKRYRRLTELSEALTTLLPQLINLLIAKKTGAQPVTATQVRKLVASVYWSLRVYMQYDFKREKFNLRDSYFNQLTLLRHELTTAAYERYFRLPELTYARYRYQPHRLHPPASLSRGTFDWLRQFLPQFHGLFLEDPEKYKHLTLTPIKVFRSHGGRKSVAEWETRNIPGLMENRFIRLTTERFGKNSSRFENMLMTTRRSPAIGGFGAAAKLRVINPVGDASPRASFFRRSFTTTTCAFVHEQATAVVLARLSNNRRHWRTDGEPLDFASATYAHRQLKERAVARLKTQELTGGLQLGVGSIDIRLQRAKSPRNSAYLERNSSQLHGAPVPAQYAHTRSATRMSRVGRKQRSATRGLTLRQESRQPQSRLHFFRADRSSRRSSGLLAARRGVRYQSLRVPVQRRLFLRLRAAKIRMYRKRALSLKQEKVTLRFVASSSLISRNRSILHFRTAKLRSTATTFTPRPIATGNTIQITKRMWALLHRSFFRSRLVYKLKGQTLKNKRFTRINRYAFVARRKSPHPAKEYTRFLRNRLRVGVKKVFLRRRFFQLKKRPQAFWARRSRRVTLVQPLKQKTFVNNFSSGAKRILINKRRLSRYVAAIEQAKSRSLFNRRRPELWKALTFRWMKKYRLLNHWLKIVKYTMYKKMWMNFEIYEALPDILFRLMRPRLRKLTWRESDEHFYRPDLRHAFTVHPKERAVSRWLEPLLFRRSVYNLRRGEYRRYQLPREQKSRKWLQRLRKLVFRRRPSHTYIKRRRWPLIRMYSQRLHRSLFHLRNAKAAYKRFRKLARHRPTATGFERLLAGSGNRLDVTLMLLNIAPTVFWARNIAQIGLLRVNGYEIRDANFRLSPGDYVEWMWEKIKKVQTFFASPLKNRWLGKKLLHTSLAYPKNFEYYPRLRAARYLRLPREQDLVESSRLTGIRFRWNHLDSGRGH